jgi:hypothetical protein
VARFRYYINEDTSSTDKTASYTAGKVKILANTTTSNCFDRGLHRTPEMRHIIIVPPEMDNVVHNYRITNFCKVLM